MNIAILAPEFLPNRGGAGTYAIELVKHLSKEYNVHVITLKRQENNEAAYSDEKILDFFDNKICLHNISNANDTFLYNVSFQYACLKHLPKICKDNNIDIVHSDVPHMSDVMLRLIKSNKNTVTTVHSIIEGHRQGIIASGLDFWSMEASELYTLTLFQIVKIIQRQYLKRSPSIITVSNWMKEVLEKNYGVEDVHVIHNGVDPNFFPQKKKNNMITVFDTNNPIVLFSGRPIALKGINILIKAIRKVINESKNIHFAFAGVVPERKWIRLFENEGIPSDYYSLLGYIPYEKMPEIYSNSTILVQPSLIENLPFSILEAMSCGLPVIGSNVGGVPEIIDDGIDGLLVKPGNSEMLAKKILFLLNNESEMKKISRNAREKITSKFTSEIMAIKTQMVYEKILKEDIR